MQSQHRHSDDSSANRSSTDNIAVLVVLLLLPLAIISVQLALGFAGQLAGGLYKLAFIIPPLVYCHSHGIRIHQDLFRWHNWRNQLGLTLLLAFLTTAIFLAFYALVGGYLIDKPTIAAKIHQQFNVSPKTVLLIAPWTILINSLIEEFFYRGFTYGRLVRYRPRLATVLPAAVFAVQHLMFAYHWVGPVVVIFGAIVLFIFSLITQAMYSRARSIVSPWIIHIAGDLAMMTIAYELVSLQA